MSASTAVIPTPQESNISLVKLLYHLDISDAIKEGRVSISKLQENLKKWEKIIPKYVSIIKQIGEEINSMSYKSPDDKSINLNVSWSQFVTTAGSLVNSLNLLSAELNSVQPNEKNLATTLNTILAQLNKSISSFDALGLNDLASNLLDKLENSFKESKSDIVSTAINNIISEDTLQKIEALFISPGDFAKLPDIGKAFYFKAMKQINYFLQDTYLMVDKYTLLFSLDLERLLNKEFKLSDKRPKTNLHTIFHNFATRYKTYIETATHFAKDDIVVETYPYTQSVIKQLEDTLKDITNKISEEDKSYAKKRTEILIALTNKYPEYCKKKLTFSSGKGPRFTDKLPVENLPEQLEQWENKGDHIPSCLDGLEAQEKHLEKLHFKPLKNIKDILVDAHNLHTNKHNRLLANKKHLEEKLATLKKPISTTVIKDEKHIVVTTPSKEHESFIEFIKLGEDYAKSFKTMHSHFNKGIEQLFNLTHEDKDAKKTIDDRIKDYEEKIQSALDPRVYQALFVARKKNETLSLAPIPSSAWIEEAAKSLLSVKECVSLLQQMTDNTNHPNHPKHIETELKKPAEISIKLSSEFITLTGAVARLAQNDFAKQFTSLTGIEHFVNATVSPMKKHTIPKGVLLIKEKLPLLNNTFDLLTFAKEFYLCIENDCKQHPIAKIAVRDMIHDLTILNSKIENNSPDKFDPASQGSFILLIFKNPCLLNNITNNCSLAVSSLKIASKDFSLQLTQKFNNILKDIFLIIDKLEIQFYLKEGFIRDQCVVSGISLCEIAESFHRDIKLSGYQFNPEESYPYTFAKKQQRESMQKTAQTNFETSFISNRIMQTKLILPQDNKHINSKAVRIINIEISIEKILNRKKLVNNTNEKIQALMKLRELSQTPGYYYEEIMEALKTKHTDYYTLLTEDRDFIGRFRRLSKYDPEVQTERQPQVIGYTPLQPSLNPANEPKKGSIDEKHSSATTTGRGSPAKSSRSRHTGGLFRSSARRPSAAAATTAAAATPVTTTPQ